MKLSTTFYRINISAVGLTIAFLISCYFEFQLKNMMLGCIYGLVIGFMIGSMFGHTSDKNGCQCGHEHSNSKKESSLADSLGSI